MLRMPEFQVHLPTTAAEAVSLRSTLPNAMYVAGGTDLLPNLKHELHHPEHLVSLSHVYGFAGITEAADGSLRIGAGTTIHELETSTVIAAKIPGVATAAALVAGPQHRRMGTIGGNVMQDTRCLFYNQSFQWRKALGSCLKSEGTWCHVIGSDKSCVAAHSSDIVPVLVALDASIDVVLPDGIHQRVPLRGLWTKDGRYDQNRALPHTALVVALHVPAPSPGHRSTYRKVRARGAVDYPQLGVAVVVSVDGDTLGAVELVIGATMPFPKRVEGLAAFSGRHIDAGLADELADKVGKQARPQPQVHGDPAWRRHLARVEARRALATVLGV
jgi:4-hydroxybenzoyl-CoA reductase subunit beta